MRDSYCKIYLDSQNNRSDLFELLRLVVDGVMDGIDTIRSTNFVLDLEDNDDFDLEAAQNPIDGFLHFRYYCDVVRLPTRSQSEYVAAVAKLLKDMRIRGMTVVPSSAFEDQLPKP